MLGEPLLPAMSVASTVMMFGPLVRETLQEKVELEREAGLPLQSTVASPLRESEAVPETFTGDLLKDAPLGGEVMARAGAVLSRLMNTLAEALLPARSVAVPLMN